MSRAGTDQVVAPRPAPEAPELRRLARGGALNLVGYIVSGVLAFVLAVIVTRILGARGAGVFFAAVAVFTILSNITELGADTGLVRFIARLTEQGRRGDLRPLLRVALVPAVTVATLAGIATVVWAEPIAEVLSRSDPADVATYLRLFGPFIPLATAATIALAGTRGFGTMRPFVAIQSFAVPALKPLLILLAAVGGLTVTGLALGWVMPEAFACAAALVVLTRMVRRAQGHA